jgi:orotate phosphoribosyltransferase
MIDGSFSLVDRETISSMTARMLLEVSAVQVNFSRPFILTSGWASPIYIDCRTLISYPRIRKILVDFATGVIMREIGAEQLDLVAGGEIAGVPFAAWLAERLMLPMQIVRRRARGLGPGSQIDGALIQEGRALLVEDIMTDGRSKIDLCGVLRNSGAKVAHVLVIFQYAIFPKTKENFDAAGIAVHSLATWRDLVTVARRMNLIEATVLDGIEAYLDDPIVWSGQHGGIDREAVIRPG